MTSSVDKILRSLACAIVLTLVACGGGGEYPQKDITIVIPFNPGGGFDTYVRALSRSLENHPRKPV